MDVAGVGGGIRARKKKNSTISSEESTQRKDGTLRRPALGGTQTPPAARGPAAAVGRRPTGCWRPRGGPVTAKRPAGRGGVSAAAARHLFLGSEDTFFANTGRNPSTRKASHMFDVQKTGGGKKYRSRILETVIYIIFFKLYYYI